MMQNRENMASPVSSLSLTGNRSFRNYSIPRGASPRLERSSSPVISGKTRRTSSGRYLSLSRDESEHDGEVSSDFAYTVHIPATPDFQTMSGTTPSVRIMADPGIASKAEQQFVSSTIFTGGFDTVTRGHVMEKMMELEAQHPQLACARGTACAVHGCDGKSIRDERGEEVLPCECNFRICRDCYIDSLASTPAKCPGCKEEYKSADVDSPRTSSFRSLPPINPARMERRLSLLKTNKPGLLMHQNSNSDSFDHSRWLYETKGTYGYGNAVWPKENGYNSKGTTNNGMGSAPTSFLDKSKKPLTRKISISPGILSPYR